MCCKKLESRCENNESFLFLFMDRFMDYKSQQKISKSNKTGIIKKKTMFIKAV